MADVVHMNPEDEERLPRARPAGETTGFAGRRSFRAAWVLQPVGESSDFSVRLPVAADQAAADAAIAKLRDAR